MQLFSFDDLALASVRKEYLVYTFKEYMILNSFSMSVN